MLKYAPTYFDLSSFTDGETKRALQRVLKKRSFKAVDTGSGSASNGRNTPAAEQPAKKKKKSAS